MSMSGFRIDAAPFLEAFNLTHRANELVAHLSQGQARKVAVLAGLLPAFASPTPTLVLLDEPDAGLDEASIEALCGWLDELRAGGHAVVLATHDGRLVDHATHLMDVAEGSVETAEPPRSTQPTVHEHRRTQPDVLHGARMHLRTMMWLNTNGMAGLLTLGGCWRWAPSWTGSMPCNNWGSFSLLRWRLGCAVSRWWRRFGNEPAPGGVPWRAANLTQVGSRSRSASSSLLSTTALHDGLETTTLLVGAGLCGVVWHGVGWLQRSTQRLARPPAVFVGLLTPVLILPYSLLLSVLS